MKKLTFFAIGLIATLNSYSQNNAPIAISDTLYVAFNDSVSFWGNQYITANDPDGDNVFIDTAHYNGSGYFSFSTLFTSPTTAFVRFNYKPSLNFWGIDSVQYIIRDNGTPVMYDTAYVYLKVKRQEFEQLNLNNINARLGLNNLFNDITNGISAFEVPKRNSQNDPKYTTIFAANLWVAGKNQGSVYLDAETFGSNMISNSFTEFVSRSGPIMDSIYYQEYDYKWDRLWKLSNLAIIYHQNNWSNAGYQPIEVIKSWPAHGDTSKGQAFYLAPFIDNNSDGLYNPYDGDYPKIKGQQAIYFIYNDFLSPIATEEPALNSKTHYMAYAYNCPSDSAINNTLFLDYTIYNRSNLTYDSTYIGAWADLDIGGYDDDFIGCDVARSSFYGYNGDDDDENNAGQTGYGVHPPAQGVTFLQGAKQDDDGIDNPYTPIIQNVLDSNGTPYAGLGIGFGDTTIDNEHWGMEHFVYYNNSVGGQGAPQIGNEYYNYLSGKWRDGTNMVWGGTGHISSGGTIPTKHMIPGITDPLWYGTGGVVGVPANWSGGFGGDVIGLGSTGPFTFEPDSSITITLAYVFGRDYQTTGAQAGVVVMQERIDSIRSYYLTDFTSVCGGALTINEKEEKESALLVYPNPFNNELTVNFELTNSSAKLAIYNLVGAKVLSQNITQKTTVIDLSNQSNGIYFITITDGENRISRKVIKQ
jgi:hypothetical protein